MSLKLRLRVRRASIRLHPTLNVQPSQLTLKMQAHTPTQVHLRTAARTYPPQTPTMQKFYRNSKRKIRNSPTPSSALSSGVQATHSRRHPPRQMFAKYVIAIVKSRATSFPHAYGQGVNAENASVPQIGSVP